MAESVEWTDKWRALPDDLRQKCRRLLKVLVEPSYTPTTGSDLAANIMGWAGPAYTTYFIPARDALARLGFITYAWGIPVTVSRDFQGFLAAAGPAWEALLDGHRVPVAPTPPAQAQAGPAFPSLVEDEAFWNRIHTQVGPIFADEVIEFGETIYIPTALQGGRRTGGRYSRPDLTYLRVGRYPLSGVKFIDVISIEAKIWGTADDIAHAYEAIAYKRFSTHVWYAYEVPNEGVAVSQEVDSVLRENGVGIIRIWRAGGEDKIRIDSRPERVDPPPDRVEAWLDLLSQADESGEVKKLLHSMFR